MLAAAGKFSPRFPSRRCAAAAAGVSRSESTDGRTHAHASGATDGASRRVHVHYCTHKTQCDVNAATTTCANVCVIRWCVRQRDDC